MAQTKAKPKPKAKSKPKAARARSRANSKQRPRSKPKPRSRSKPADSLISKPKAAGEAVEDVAKDAGRVVSRAASKAKVPLVAGGAALAGAAGGMALAHQTRRHRGIAGVTSSDVARAARKAGDLGVQVGEIALEVRRARQVTNGKVHRSPIEVVLQGLTARRQHQ
jgi:hypothetical protein